MILPPDDKDGVPFYQDPSDRPGMHRDLFKTWGCKLIGELHLQQFSLTSKALTLLPLEYLSSSEASEEEDERSVSSCGVVDSSDEEGAHLPRGMQRPLDSSDEEGAHR